MSAIQFKSTQYGHLYSKPQKLYPSTSRPTHQPKTFEELGVSEPLLQCPLPAIDKIHKKYNVLQILEYQFQNAKTLSELAKSYHDLNGEPGFIVDKMNLEEQQFRFFLRQSPDLVEWNNEGNFVLLPSPRYVQQEQLVNQPTTAKNNAEGFALGGWFIHPNRLRQSPFIDPEVRKGGQALQAALDATEKPEDKKENTTKNVSISTHETSDEPYLATILDLDHSHLDWLKNIRDMTQKHLTRMYGVDLNKDYVKLYFHFPYSEATGTLHLHARVNVGTHNLELAKCYELDDIIEVLEQGHSVADLVLARQQLFGGRLVINPTIKVEVEGIKGARVGFTENPFRSVVAHSVQVAMGEA